MIEQASQDGEETEGYEEVLLGNLTLGIRVSPRFVGRVDTKRLAAMVQRTMGPDWSQANLELGLLIVDDELIRKLNREFRGQDTPTDVLAFAMSESGSPPLQDLQDLQDPSMPIYLGDVIISFPRAEAQACAAGHSGDDELDLLVVHGVLHLLGFDHDTETKRKEMWARQEAILGKRLID